MIERVLQAAAFRDAQQPFIIDRNRVWSYAASWTAVRRMAHGLMVSGANRLVAYMDDSAELIHLLIAASLAGKTILVANRLCTAEELAEVASNLSADMVISPATIEPMTTRQCSIDAILTVAEGTGQHSPSDFAGQGEVFILTSGTTGRSKCAAYAWDRLMSQVHRRADQRYSRWLLLYQLNHFAGFQMVAHVISNTACLVIPQSLDVARVANAIESHAVTHASGTPTFWRMFAGMRRERLRCLRQITLGGEAATSDLLEKLRSLFPDASISQVYATTELGSCFSTSDGLPGFPASLLDDAARPIQLKVIDGELYVRSVNGMSGYVSKGATDSLVQRRDDDWVATGDLVTQVGDRFFFRGRVSETVNVGGVKVNPLEVEACILAVDGVLAAHVFGRPNPVTGSIVVAEIVCDHDRSSESIIAAVREACLRSLTRYQRPRFVEAVPSLKTVNRKVRRHASTITLSHSISAEHDT